MTEFYFKITNEYEDIRDRIQWDGTGFSHQNLIFMGPDV